LPNICIISNGVCKIIATPLKGRYIMIISPIPDFSFRTLTDVTPEFLNQLGIKFLMLDLDNTIAAYDEHLPSDALLQWAQDVRSQGVELYIVSNSLRKKRVAAFTQELDVGVIMNAHKPSPNGVFKAMETSGHTVESSAFIGDQIFTDTLAANRAGVISIIVRPLRFTNPFLALRFAAEAPFRAMCKNNSRNKKTSSSMQRRTAKQKI